MSCFWDSILNKLKEEDFQKVLNHPGKPKSKKFAELLKLNNKKTNDVLWKNQYLTEKQCDENYEHIQEYDLSVVDQGYYCSVCDPFLLLICELFMINIQHVYIGTNIEYTHKKNVSNNNYTITLQSDKSHMW